MKDQDAADIEAFFHNPRIQKSLSGLGLFAIDFANKRAFPSSVWLACGYSSQEMIANLLPDLLHPDDRARVVAASAALFAQKTDHLKEVFRIRNKAGAWVWIATTCAIIYRDDKGTPLLYVGHDQDLTELKSREAESVRRLEEIETLRQVIADVNTSLDLRETVSLILEHTRRVIPYQKSSVQLLEGDELAIVGCMGFDDRQATLALRFPFPISGSPSTIAVQSREPVICNDIARGFPGFLQVPGEEPTRSWLGIPLIANNEVIGLVALDSVVENFYNEQHLRMAQTFAGHVALVVDKARVFERVQSMALNDNLTGVGNRHSLQLHGPFFLEKAKREKTRLIALMVDFDHFKLVNDSFGHDAGDTVLKEGAQVIRSCLRSYDLFIRYGGEEFLILLPESRPEAAWEIAERIRTTVFAYRFSSLNRAHLALYEAKTLGRNQTKTLIL